jgi:hypothetical protein
LANAQPGIARLAKNRAGHSSPMRLTLLPI